MPFSDHPPMQVFPDVDWGRTAAGRTEAHGVTVALCSKFEQDESPIQNKWSIHLDKVCANRNSMGERRHNWCFRCCAGYPVWYDESTDDSAHYKQHRGIRA